ncbi:hypothetical protein KIF24_11550 [Micromonospora sp. Llam7]|uniref:hypothetical protein n=1 Tax=Micromonospora tarapacensis TaxID=2835305 RepID=UPI001C82F695|nr:hypothetical protein [Micromonospora tarapacensis]MBX7266613.1 hypothetical protein [Micromonospora tarapacensis]
MTTYTPSSVPHAFELASAGDRSIGELLAYRRGPGIALGHLDPPHREGPAQLGGEGGGDRVACDSAGVRERLHADLVELARRSNVATDGTVRLPSAYLEVIAERAA